MSIKAQTYIELLKICLSDNPFVSDCLVKLSKGHIDWIDLLDFAAKQGIIGVYWHGIEMLFKSPTAINKPNDDEVMEWWGEIQDIRKRNEDLFKKTEFVSRTFKKEGFDNCILKGQGNALMYPDPYLRTPGDIDIWLCGDHDKIENYVKKLFPNTKSGNLHIDFPVFKDTLVEVHYTPSHLANPITNKQLQRYFNEEQGKQVTNMQTLPNGKSIPIPTLEFNIIFQLSHILRHYIYEGISLKQLVDYFYVLKEHHTWKRSLGCKAGKNIQSVLPHLGMQRFASVIMYIMNVFGLEEDYLFTKMNDKGGKIILDSIVNEEDIHSSSLHNMNDLSRYNSAKERQKIKLHRLIKLFPYFPGETIWGFFPRIVGTIATSQ
jgi:hypothetical protein